MNKLSAKHSEFIRLVASGTNQSEAYRATVGNPKATIKACKAKASQLAKKYADLIAQERERLQSIITSTKDEEVIKKAVANIVSQSQADEVAFRVLKDGEMVSDVVIIAGAVKVISRKPTQAEIQKAYQNYNLRFGSNAPVKQDVKVEDSRPATKITLNNGTTIEL